jgi:predicted component of type VI protein secretion system
MRTSIVADEASAEPSEAWLEVRRGQTRAPKREIRGRRFLIGAGSNCQLQLGGGDVPILHSILLVEEDGAHIDAVVPSPQLLVNGRPQRSADLQDGDVFSIGKFEFQVHVPQPHAALHASVRPELPIPQSASELEQLTASQLVALIESEQQQIDELESGRVNGARALLDAARRTAETAVEPALISFPQSSGAAKTEPEAGTEETIPLSSRRAS